ncbi:Aste57867_8222 [Aphanomyces stellatus]|uniref:Aste57867_8222 protein n=1 Tax=Aphanomyces stellatus TaxID=120398 RepID=A0A485KJN5_9STRA|nr:hypothetical protein As57867_008191 [Aphanomyces stellatus]VFT85109.1 Aste57867_8222 [Aphanomyces stellatus]
MTTHRLASPMAPPLMELFSTSISLESLQGAHVHTLSEHASQLEPMWTWFESLGYDEQRNVLSFVDAEWISTLRTLHSLVMDRKHEDGVFILLNDPPKKLHHASAASRRRQHKKHPETTPLLERCAFQTWHDIEGRSPSSAASPRLDTEFIVASRQLLSSVRLWDHATYVDAVWIKRSGCMAKGSFQRLLTHVLLHGYRSVPIRHVLPTSSSYSHNPTTVVDTPSSPKLDVLTLAGFVAIRVVENLLDEFHRGGRIVDTGLSIKLNRLALLWDDTTDADQHALLRHDTKGRVQRILNRRLDLFNEASYTLAADQLLDLLDNNVLNDAQFIAESLYTSSIGSVGTCVDLIAREIGADVQVAYSDRVTANLVRQANDAAEAAVVATKPKKKKSKKKAHATMADGDRRHVASVRAATSSSTTNASPVRSDKSDDILLEYDVSSSASSSTGGVPVHDLAMLGEADDDDDDEVHLLEDNQQRRSVSPARRDHHARDAFALALHHDVLEMFAMLQDIVARRRPWQICVVTHVKDCVSRLWPRADVNVFGSFATGLNCPKSDVDLLITGAPSSSSSNMENLAALLRHEPWVQAIHVIDKTAIPLLKVTTGAIPTSCGDAQGVIQLDITFDRPEHRGVETCVFVQRLAAVLPELTPLVLVLKQFLQHANLNDSYTGGLSSYGLTLLVASILHPLQFCGQRPNLGHLVLHFLQLFGCDFDPTTSFVRSTHGGPILDRGAAWPTTQNDVVVIEDPLRPEFNVAKTCFGFPRVQGAFRLARQRIEEMLPTFAAAVDEDDLPGWHSSQGQSVLGCLFDVPHHGQVVGLPRYNTVPAIIGAAYTSYEDPSPVEPVASSDTALEEWSVDAMQLLQQLGSKACVVCGGTGSMHVPGCRLYGLLHRFHAL